MAAGLINIILLIYLIKNKKKNVYIKQIILGIIQGILYLPWLVYFISQLSTMHSNGFWIKINTKTIVEILGFSFSGMLNEFLGLSISIFVYGYTLYLIKKNGLKQSMPAVIAILIYILVIIAALIISKILGTGILYYRYIVIITGLMFFAIAYMFSKDKKPYFLYGYIIIALIISISSNIKLINDNYATSNKRPIEYIEKNIQKGDVIVYPQVGSGSTIAVKFPEYKQYFYNQGNWGVEEAYKAFGPNMSVHIDKDFLNYEECQGRIWLITSEGDDTFYKETFENEKYKLISKEYFLTAYQKYEYQIFLIEKIKDV